MSEGEEKNTAELTEEKVEKAKAKVKDPKKVAAGKRLAELNRRGREAAAEKEKEKEKEEEKEETIGGWGVDKSSITGAILVGGGIAAAALYAKYRQGSEPPPPPPPPPPPSPAVARREKRVERRIGME